MVPTRSGLRWRVLGEDLFAAEAPLRPDAAVGGDGEGVVATGVRLSAGVQDDLLQGVEDDRAAGAAATAGALVVAAGLLAAAAVAAVGRDEPTDFDLAQRQDDERAAAASTAAALVVPTSSR